MNHHKRLFRMLILCTLFICLNKIVGAQVQTARYNTVINSNVKGFYEYLPEGYNSNNDKYPLILFFHGAGERGDGSTAQLPKVLYNGIPKLIKNGQFPKSFTVNGQSHKFIVISPQLVDVGNAAQVNDIINYAVANYRVDINRIYLTGLSMGGGMCFLYLGTNSTHANRIAAMVPVCEAYGYSINIAQNIANANIAVWATHNNADPTVSVTKTHQYVDGINSFSPSNVAKKTIFQSSSHDAWTKTYDPNFRENGLNIYEWLLQYNRGIATPPPPPPPANLPPVANAGSDVTITLPVNSVSLSGSGTDQDGSITSYAWTKVSGPQATISNASSAQTTISNLVAGTYVFRLTVKDNKAASATNDVSIIVKSAPVSGGENQRVLIDVGSKTTSVDQWGKHWNNMLNARPGTPLVNAKTTTNTPTTISLQVINRIDGTFGTSGTAVNTGNNLGIVGDYPASVTTDFAFAHYTTTSGKWRIYGLDASKQYSIKFWGGKSHSNNYSIQIKRSDETAWQEYNASFNNDFNRAAVFTIAGKQEVSFDIKTKAGTAGFGYINVIDIQTNGDGGTTTPTPPQNKLPVANAGSDINLQLPQSSVVLSGSGSDADGTISKYTWRKISGPGTVSFSSSSSAQTTVSNLSEGIYEFELEVTDNSGGTGKDIVTLVVVAAETGGIGKRINVNITNGSNPYNNTEWNNWSVGTKSGSNFASPIFKHSDGSASTVKAILSSGQGVADNGSSYGSGMAPKEVLRYGSFSTVSRTLTISGLSTSKTYDLEFYASRTTSGNTSVFVINNVSKSVSSFKNFTNKIVFTSVKPDNQGRIIVSLTRVGTYGYLNGFALTENGSGTESLAVQSSNKEISTESVKIFPVPFNTRITLQVDNELKGQMKIQLFNMTGSKVSEYSMYKEEGPVQVYLSTTEIKSGSYIIKVQIGDWNYSQNIIKL